MVGRIKKIEIGKGKKEGEEYLLTSQEIPKRCLETDTDFGGGIEFSSKADIKSTFPRQQFSGCEGQRQ